MRGSGEELTGLDSGLGKGCHYLKWEIKRRYQFGEGSCRSTFNHLSSSCCGMLQWKRPAGGWPCSTGVRTEAGLGHLRLFKALAFPASSPGASSDLSQTRLSSWRAFTHCVCRVALTRCSQPTSEPGRKPSLITPSWILVPNFLSASGHFFFCIFHIVL